MNHHRPSETHGDRLPARSDRWFLDLSDSHGRPEREIAADVGDLWRIVVRRRVLILGTCLAFFGAALLYGFLATPQYTAKAQLLIDPRDRQVVSRDLNASEVAPDGGITVVETQAKVIGSDAVLMRAVAAAGLENDPDFGAPPPSLLRRALRSLGSLVSRSSAEPERTALALTNLRRKLTVSRADKVFVVDILVTASDPDKAARVANAIAAAYLADQSEARAEAAKRAAGEVSSRLASLKADVTAAETRLEAFKAKNELIASSGRLVSEQQLTDSNAQLVAARNRTAEAKSRLQDLRNLHGAALDASATPEALQSPTIEHLRTQYAELVSREANLRMQLGDRHPFIASVHAQEADVRRLIAGELARIVRGAEVDYQRAATAEQLLGQNLDALRAEAVRTNQAGGQLRELESAVTASRSVYDTYLVRARELSEQANVDPTNARVVTVAQPPQERSWPLRGLLAAAGLAGGLGVGVGLAMLREFAEPTLLSSGQLGRLLRVPVLASFPPCLRSQDSASVREAMVALDGLRGFSARDHASASALVVVVTATERDRDARRATIDLLADVAAVRGDKVLIVDTHVAGSAVGFGGLLAPPRGEISLQAGPSTDAAGGVRRVSLDQGGTAVRGASEQIDAVAFFAQITSRFDLVIVDGGVLTSNLRIAAFVEAADRLVLVARTGRTLQSDLIELDRIATAMGQPPCGALLVRDRARRR